MSSIELPIGTMIELPRAAMTAHRDRRGRRTSSPSAPTTSPRLTWGFSRDDVEAAFFAAYLEDGHLRRSARSSPSTWTASAGSSAIARPGGQGEQPRPQDRRLRRARWRPGVDPLLRRDPDRLRVLLAVPGAGGPAGGRPRRPRWEVRGDGLTAPLVDAPGLDSARPPNLGGRASRAARRGRVETQAPSPGFDALVPHASLDDSKGQPWRIGPSAPGSM